MRAHLSLSIVGLVLLGTGCTVSESPAVVAPTAPVLVIVTATPGVPAAPAGPRTVEQRYVVREGDTLSTIAARFDVTEPALLAANDLSDPDRIMIGQELVIPPPEP
ncbi:MAG: LysM peptidoglycan-binding domain-containing protein [Chloroflexota bacterium]|nr:LysM peptidoglycan-binding domain-containing protein [Chloroflexota bacterium]